MVSEPAQVEVRPSGRDVVVFNDHCFSEVRKSAGVPDNFINEGFDFDKLESGGGKGGTLMAFIGADYIVKELSNGDHQALLGIAESYLEHVRNGDTLLSAIFIHFEDCATSRRFYAMGNVVGNGPFLAKYDLKGCNDDKTLELFGEKVSAAKRMVWHASHLCRFSSSAYRCEFTSGKRAAAKADLVVTEGQREEVVRRMRRDAKWLASNQLMDYSLIVGIKTLPPAVGCSLNAHTGRLECVRTCADGSEVAVCVGIIDFLQRWTLVKMAARAIKCLECNKATIPPDAYALRFCDHFEERFISAKVKEPSHKKAASGTSAELPEAMTVGCGQPSQATAEVAATVVALAAEPGVDLHLAQLAPPADAEEDEGAEPAMHAAASASVHEEDSLLERSPRAAVLGAPV